MAILTTPTQKSLNQLLAFLNLYQHAKNEFIPSVHFWDSVNFRVSWPDWPHQFLNMTTQIIFNQLSIFVNLCQHAKNQLFHLFIFQTQSIAKSCHQTGHTHFWPCQPQKFQAPFNLHEFLPACKKSVNSICSFFRYSQF